MEAMGESSRIILNISGTKYEVTRNSLLTQASSRLGQLASSLESTKLEEMYFNRPSVPFEAILMFYQTGKLHLPPNICPNVFKEELEYWEIDHALMEQCCFLNYIQFLDSYKTKSDFKSSIKKVHDYTSSPLARKDRVWSIIDYQERTWLSKIFLFVGVAFVLLSVSTLALSTLPQYKRKLTTCEWYEYVVADDAIDPEVKNYFMKYDCRMLKVITTGNEFQFDFDQKEPPQQFQPQKQHVGKRSIPNKGNNQITTSSTNVTQNGSIDEHNSQPDTLKTTFPTLTLKNDIFYQIDYLATAFFTVELSLRLLVCPSLKVYFMNFLNVIEFVVLIGTYVDIVIFNMKSGYKFSPTFTSLIDFIKFLRVIRLLRYCQHLAAVKVLKFSLRQNSKDLLVLLFHIVIILLIFANIIYLAEERDNIDSIPQGWWLGLITLTTVGYGDLSPKTFVGKMACSVCALCGIIMMSLIIPIFVETFVQLYGIAHIGNRPSEKSVVRPMKLNKVREIDVKQYTASTEIKEKY